LVPCLHFDKKSRVEGGLSGSTSLTWRPLPWFFASPPLFRGTEIQGLQIICDILQKPLLCHFCSEVKSFFLPLTASSVLSSSLQGFWSLSLRGQADQGKWDSLVQHRWTMVQRLFLLLLLYCCFASFHNLPFITKKPLPSCWKGSYVDGIFLYPIPSNGNPSLDNRLYSLIHLHSSLIYSKLNPLSS
jgi:hypothetical protein